MTALEIIKNAAHHAAVRSYLNDLSVRLTVRQYGILIEVAGEVGDEVRRSQRLVTWSEIENSYCEVLIEAINTSETEVLNKEN